MFSLFGFLFGSAYLGVKVAQDSIAKEEGRAYERRLRAQISCIDKIRATVYERNDADAYVLSGTNYDEICQRFQKDFEYVYGSNWKDLLRIPPYKIERYEIISENYPAYWVSQLILADQGKLGCWTADGRYMSILSRHIAEVRKYAICVANRLKARGIQADIITEIESGGPNPVYCIKFIV